MKKKELCKGRVVTVLSGENYEVTKSNNNHNHAPDNHRKYVLKALYKIKTQAKETREKPQVIIQSVKRKLVKDVVVDLPSTRALRERVKRQRVEEHGLENCTGRNVEIPNSVAFHDGQPFLLGDEWIGEDRILVFGSVWGLRQLCAARVVLTDGTFRCAPYGFTQIYSLHASYNCNGKLY